MYTLEYELIEISFAQKYDVEGEMSFKPQYVHDDGEADASAEIPAIQYDADGIPMGQSMAEIRMREGMIDTFFRRWVEEHPEKEVFNIKVADNIRIRKISIDEAKQHASKSYLSTVAILKYFDEILTNAVSIGKTAIKQNDRNQSQFDYMLIMSYQCQEIGLAKLTVGIRKKQLADRKLEETKTEYGISIMPEGQKIEIPRKADKHKRKAPHKK